jgi:hypothetical protein
MAFEIGQGLLGPRQVFLKARGHCAAPARYHALRIGYAKQIYHCSGHAPAIPAAVLGQLFYIVQALIEPVVCFVPIF